MREIRELRQKLDPVGSITKGEIIKELITFFRNSGVEIDEAQIVDSYSVFTGEQKVHIENKGHNPVRKKSCTVLNGEVNDRTSTVDDAAHVLEDALPLNDSMRREISSRYTVTSTNQEHDTPVFRSDQFKFVEQTSGLRVRITDPDSPFFNCILPHTDNVLALTQEKKVLIVGKDGKKKIVKKYGCPFDGCDYATEKRSRIVRHAFSSEHMALSRESFVKAIAPYLFPELQCRTLRALLHYEQFAFWHQADPSCLSNSYGNQRLLQIALKAGEMQADCDVFVADFCATWNTFHSKYGTIEWGEVTKKASFPVAFDNPAGRVIWEAIRVHGRLNHKPQHCIGRIPTNDGFNTERGVVTADNFIYTKELDDMGDAINVETKCFQEYRRGKRLEVMNESLSTHTYLFAKCDKELRLNIFFALKDDASLRNWRMDAFYDYMAQRPHSSSRFASFEEAAHHGYNGGLGGRLHLLGDGGVTVTKFRDTRYPDVKEATTLVWFPDNDRNPHHRWNNGRRGALEAGTADRKLVYYFWVLRSGKNFFEIDGFAALISEISALKHGYQTSYKPQFVEITEKIRRLNEDVYKKKYIVAEMEKIDDKARHEILVEETKYNLRDPEPWREKKQYKEKGNDTDRAFVSAALDILLSVREKKTLLKTTRMDKPLAQFIDIYHKLLLNKETKERLKNIIKTYVFYWKKLKTDNCDINFTTLQGGAKGCDKKSSPERPNIVILRGLYSLIGNITGWFNNRGNARSDVHCPPKLIQVQPGVSTGKAFYWSKIKNIIQDWDEKDLVKRIDSYFDETKK